MPHSSLLMSVLLTIKLGCIHIYLDMDHLSLFILFKVNIVPLTNLSDMVMP